MTDEKNLNLSDREFNVIRTLVQNSTEQDIIKFMCDSFIDFGKNVSNEILLYILNFYKKYKFWGNFDPAEC